MPNPTSGFCVTSNEAREPALLGESGECGECVAAAALTSCSNGPNGPIPRGTCRGGDDRGEFRGERFWGFIQRLSLSKTALEGEPGDRGLGGVAPSGSWEGLGTWNFVRMGVRGLPSAERVREAGRFAEASEGEKKRREKADHLWISDSD
jgi:hypothetical protein